MQDRCRDCQNALTTARNQTPEGKLAHRRYNRLHMQRNRHHYAANDTNGPERVRAYLRRNPNVKAARDAVYHALKAGTLVRGPCEECGDGDTQAHHDDYSLPLSVRWLCRRHHYHHHVQEREHAPRQA